MLTTPRGAPSDRVCGTSPGIHRCVGSNLARLELLVALQEWLRAFPNYRLDESRPTTWANGQVRGPRNIPVLLA